MPLIVRDLKDIEYKDVKKPIIQDKSVIINVKSVGVNFPDGLLVQGKYQLKLRANLVLLQL